jgi:hypothetical protein
LLKLDRTEWKFGVRNVDIVLLGTYYRNLKKIATQTQVSLLASDTPALRQQVQPERVSHEIACPSLAVQAENFKSNLEMIRSSLLQVNIYSHF